jgi:hypothetical protein
LATLLTFVLPVALALPQPASRPQSAQPGDVPFHVEELLMLPDANGVSLVMVPAVDASLYVEYREEPSGTWQTTARRVVTASQRVEFRLEGLRRDRAHTYRVMARRAGEKAPHEPRRFHGFRTTREPGRTFSFAYATDAHTWNIFSQHLWGSMAQIPIASLRQGLTNLTEDDLDFVVLGGDTTVTHLIGGAGGEEDGIVYEPGSVSSGQQGILRYRRVFGPDLIGLPMPSLPFVYVLGNHEAEVGFATPAGPCGFFDDAALGSEIGRRALFSDPHEVYGGNEEGSYYAFESGDALVVVLDVLRYVPSLPATANHWTLGPEQMAWLEDVLAESSSTATGMRGAACARRATTCRPACSRASRSRCRRCSRTRPPTEAQPSSCADTTTYPSRPPRSCMPTARAPASGT